MAFASDESQTLGRGESHMWLMLPLNLSLSVSLYVCIYINIYGHSVISYLLISIDIYYPQYKDKVTQVTGATCWQALNISFLQPPTVFSSQRLLIFVVVHVWIIWRHQGSRIPSSVIIGSGCLPAVCCITLYYISLYILHNMYNIHHIMMDY